jgi:hypothetical protein
MLNRKKKITIITTHENTGCEREWGVGVISCAVFVFSF